MIIQNFTRTNPSRLFLKLNKYTVHAHKIDVIKRTEHIIEVSIIELRRHDVTLCSGAGVVKTYPSSTILRAKKFCTFH